MSEKKIGLWIGGLMFALALLGGIYRYAENQGELQQEVKAMNIRITDIDSKIDKMLGYVPRPVLDSLSAHNFRLTRLEEHKQLFELRQGQF